MYAIKMNTVVINSKTTKSESNSQLYTLFLFTILRKKGQKKQDYKGFKIANVFIIFAL